MSTASAFFFVGNFFYSRAFNSTLCLLVTSVTKSQALFSLYAEQWARLPMHGRGELLSAQLLHVSCGVPPEPLHFVSPFHCLNRHRRTHQLTIVLGHQDVAGRFEATFGDRGLAASPFEMNEEFHRVLQSQMVCTQSLDSALKTLVTQASNLSLCTRSNISRGTKIPWPK